MTVPEVQEMKDVSNLNWYQNPVEQSRHSPNFCVTGIRIFCGSCWVPVLDLLNRSLWQHLTSTCTVYYLHFFSWHHIHVHVLYFSYFYHRELGVNLLEAKWSWGRKRNQPRKNGKLWPMSSDPLWVLSSRQQICLTLLRYAFDNLQTFDRTQPDILALL